MSFLQKKPNLPAFAFGSRERDREREREEIALAGGDPFSNSVLIDVSFVPMRFLHCLLFWLLGAL